MKWEKICTLTELKEAQIHSVSLETGKKIILIRDKDDVYALENCCSHDQGDLEGGQVYDGLVECPRHGALFDVCTGEAKGLPATRGIGSFPVEIRDGVVYVSV